MKTPNANQAFLPEQIGQLIVLPVTQQSVAMQASTVIQTAEGEHEFRVPLVSDDPTAAWTAEGEEINASDAVLDEASTGYYKLAGLTVITRELADDSSPDVAEQVGAGLARDVSRKLDAAYFSEAATGANAPAGIGSLDSTVVAAGTKFTNLDPFNAAVFNAETLGAQLTSFVANPADALALAQLKESTTSARDLLQPDPTKPTQRTIAGIPLLTSPTVKAGTVWGIPNSRSLIALRQGTTLDVDRSVFFTSDKVAIRATFRTGFVFPQPKAIQKIKLGS
ncbi:phage major capsid protein [Curtobacterium sp. AB451]|uniref:phage major capsid protein n=1 Tax=Curtobacterium sp. AB451 TaxID=3422306 RepID=UPI003D3400C7